MSEDLDSRRTAGAAEIERVAREVTLSEERLASLAAEVATIRRDSASITAALIQAAKTERKLSEDIEGITDRLETLTSKEDVLRMSLAARRDVLAEVLGALQRMGLNPPPALLVTPDDALASVRSAILLGAVVPGLRSETDILMTDLRELSRIVASIQAERDKLASTVREQAAEQKRLALLLEQKSRMEIEKNGAIEAEQARAVELAEKAKSLTALLAALEKEATDRRSSQEAALKAEEARAEREAKLAALPIPDANKLATPKAFAELSRQLPLPAAGRFARRFGGDDGNGGVMLGDTVATQSGAIVTAPADGSVLYAGPFRSYGQLLILDAGGGYHVVLAGMGRISVAAGQSVVAGEPLGAMGDPQLASAAGAGISDADIRDAGDGIGIPELYVEFRKDGKPVDPGPWWSVRLSGRTGNDS